MSGIRQAAVAGMFYPADPDELRGMLQEYLQARGWSLPSYQILDVSGEAHQQSFRVECRIDELSLASVGTGNSRRRAEQAAANQLLEQLLITA